MAKQIDLAEAQFIGFHHGKSGFSARKLAESMGLKKSEWLQIREQLSMTESDKEEVDALFFKKSKK